MPSLLLFSCSIASDSLWPTRLLCPWDFPDKNTTVGCHALLQGIFPTQGLNLSLLYLLHCRQILYWLSHQGSPLKHGSHPVSTGRWIEKQNWVETYSGILFGFEKEGNSDTCYNTDEDFTLSEKSQSQKDNVWIHEESLHEVPRESSNRDRK